jgi:phage terminase large subunit
VFRKNKASTKRIKANEGGTRSSKTYSIAQLIAILAAAEKEPTVYAICRKTFPALKATAMRDFFSIIKGWGWYSEANHNKSDHIYKLNNTDIEFFSLDEPEKVRGRKRKILWVNEANELEYEDWRQLLLRTSGDIYMDYNPSDEFSWIYDHVLTRPDCDLIKSTYLDNPFLEETIIGEIERLKGTDENYWKIYGLGLRGVSTAKIYSHWQLCDDFPKGCERIFGLDFGFNNQTALVEVGIKDDNIYARERLYKSGMTNGDLIEWLKKHRMQEKIIYADSAEPQRIKEIEDAGFVIEAADKDVLMGIDSIKRRKFYITKDSVNGLKEAKSYSWKTGKDGKRIDEPVKHNDHFMDATRYAVYTYFNAAGVGAEWL